MTASSRSFVSLARSSALALAVLAATGGAAHAMGPMPPPPPPLEDRIESLDLDDATRERVYAVLDAAVGPRRAAHRALEAERRRMRLLLAEGSSTDDAIRAEAMKLDQLEHEAHLRETDVLLKVRATLPEKLRGSLGSLAPPERGAPESGARGDRGARADGDPAGGAACAGPRGNHPGRAGDRAEHAPDPPAG